MFKLLVTGHAKLQAFVAADYYDAINIALGERFLEQLQIAYNKITENPQFYSYTAFNVNFRRINLYKFPYIVVYEIDRDRVVVLAVLNTRQQAELHLP